MSDLFKRFATDANYVAPTKPWDGQPTKVEPSAGQLAQGYQPDDQPAAQHYNWLLNQQYKLADAIYNPALGVEAIRQYPNLTALGLAATNPHGTVAYVPGFGLYQWDSASVVATLNRFIVSSVGTGRWFHTAYGVRDGAFGLAPLDVSSKVPNTSLYYGVPSGVATLDGMGTIPGSQLVSRLQGLTLTAADSLPQLSPANVAVPASPTANEVIILNQSIAALAGDVFDVTFDGYAVATTTVADYLHIRSKALNKTTPAYDAPKGYSRVNSASATLLVIPFSVSATFGATAAHINGSGFFDFALTAQQNSVGTPGWVAAVTGVTYRRYRS